MLGLLTALLLGSKLAMAWLPNIEPVSLLIMVYAAVLGLRALLPIYAYVLLEYALRGFGLGWAVLSGAFGLCFGGLCALTYLAVGGWAFALSWWVQGIPFDVLHCAGNFVLALVLFRPCKGALARLWAGRTPEAGGR